MLSSTGSNHHPRDTRFLLTTVTNLNIDPDISECGETHKDVLRTPLLRNVNQVCRVAPVLIDNANVV